MATLRVIKVQWSGLTGLPGVSVFHSLDSVTGALSEIHDYFDAIKPYFPNGLQWSFPGSGDTIDGTNGHLVGGWADTQPADVAATGTGYHAAGVGIIHTWHTGVVVGTRRLRGRTFLAPLASANYEVNGTVTSACLAAIKAAGDSMWASGILQVWHRPSGPGATDGSNAVVVSSTVKDQVTRLRSRTI